MPIRPEWPDDALVSRLCNDDAVHKMHQLFLLLPVSIALMAVGIRVLSRRRIGPDRSA
jgi:hypothetical protein